MKKSIITVIVVIAFLLGANRNVSNAEIITEMEVMTKATVDEDNLNIQLNVLDTKEGVSIMTNKGVVISDDFMTLRRIEYFIDIDGEMLEVPYNYFTSGNIVKVLKVTDNEVILCIGDVAISRLDRKTKEFETIVDEDEAIWKMCSHNENYSKLWWIDNSCTGHVFYVDTEEIIDIPNVKGVAKDFPGFYVDDNRGVETVNGKLLLLEDITEKQLKAEGQRIDCLSLVDVEGINYNVLENGEITFANTEFTIKSGSDTKIIKVLHEYGENTTVDIGVVTLEEDVLFLYNFEKNTKTKIAEGVLPRTISASEESLMWLDSNYTGHFVENINDTEVKSEKDVLGTDCCSMGPKYFITVSSDSRLKRFGSIVNGLIVE